ncbi:unnamed protein product [Caretta caretta]
MCYMVIISPASSLLSNTMDLVLLSDPAFVMRFLTSPKCLFPKSLWQYNLRPAGIREPVSVSPEEPERGGGSGSSGVQWAVDGIL